jgi:demethylmenaquinone methyltransferase / 2-methoxy-6-polyprenyl-1,4-benzoquinol methylase
VREQRSGIASFLDDAGAGSASRDFYPGSAQRMGTPLGSPDDLTTIGRAVRGMFAAIAPRYDFLNHLLSLGCDIYWRKAAARELRALLAGPESVALDVCCGTGDLAFALARFSRGCVIGTDFCYPMLLRAGQKAAAGNRIGRTFRTVFMEADTLALPFRDGCISVVTSAFGFRNLASYQRGLEEMYRVLAPGGVLAILEFSRIRSPLLGPVFRYYFRRLLPRIGTWISGVSGPYQYLPDSVAKFPDQQQLAAAMRSTGLVKVRYRNFFFGAAALHLAEKPIAR